MMAPGLYGCIYAPEFAAQALLRLRHGLRGRPVGVLAGESSQERVCAANAAARREGLRNGMTRVEAEAFEGMALLRRSTREEAEARAAMLACAGKYTPSIEEASTEHEAVCVLDLAGTKRLFGEPMSVAERLARELRGFGIHATIALSANYHAALARARAGGGVVEVGQGREQEALAPLLLSVLPLSQEQEQTLALWGIRTLGGLAALPERELVARMGQAGKRLRALARGEQPHHFQPAEPGFTLRESFEFDAPVAVLDSLLFVLSPMLDQLLLRAGERALALAQVTVAMQLEGGAEHTRTVRPALATADRKLLLKLLQLDLAAHPPAAAVLALSVTGDPGEQSKVQLGLFSPQLPESSRLDVTLARLRALVGEGHVGSPKLQDNHAPDSFGMEGFAVQRVRALQGARLPEAPVVRRVRPPAPLAMRVEQRTPAGFWYAERQYRIVAAYGPWRESGQWWSTAVWSREQWDVFAEASNPVKAWRGAAAGEQLCCRVLFDLVRKQWMLEAIYD